MLCFAFIMGEFAIKGRSYFPHYMNLDNKEIQKNDSTNDDDDLPAKE